MKTLRLGALMLVAAAAVAAAAKKPAADAVPARAPVDCADAASIRAFKDAVWSIGWGSKEEIWAACLCGPAAAKAGVSDPRPPRPRSAPAWRLAPRGDAAAGRVLAVKWFTTHLNLSPDEAATIAACLHP
ncbi:MAG: hypothetical protein SF051_10370 [Elusimicrobiota bacterium]|nr:hypothetical protein [Elusimicrobiota bacterium]